MARKRTVRKNPVGRPTRKPDTEVLGMMLRNHSSSEIADVFGVSDSTVRSWIFREKKKGVNAYGR